MLHATLTDHSEFIALREELAGRLRVILPDARGHGASPSLQNQWYSVAELAADVIAVLDAEEIESVNLVGHELGGTVAFEIARRHADRVQTLTLIEPELGSVLDNDPHPEMREARAAQRATDRAAGDAAYKQLADRSLDGYLVPRWGQDWRASVTKPRMGSIRRHAAALAGILPALDGYIVERQDAAELATPTLILRDEEAGMLDRAIALRLKDWLKNADVRTATLGDRALGAFRDEEASVLAHFLLDFWAATGAV